MRLFLVTQERINGDIFGGGYCILPTAVGRKKIVLEQQLNAATLNMSPTKWNELLEIRKRKWGKEEVVGAPVMILCKPKKSSQSN
jgi:hypothetical protein